MANTQTHSLELDSARLADDPLILIIPGLGNSGPGHWQTLWEAKIPDCERVELGMWDDPHRNTWVNKINLAVHRAGRPVILVAHSLGCQAVAWWARYEQPGFGNPVVGALLVAPPDVEREGVARLQARGGGVEEDFNGGVRVAGGGVDGWEPFRDFRGEFLGLGGGAVHEPKFSHAFVGQAEGGSPGGTAGTEEQDTRAAGFDGEILAEGADDRIGIGVVAPAAHRSDGVRGDGSDRHPLAVRCPGLEADGVDRAPGAGRVVEFIDQVDRQEFVRDGQVQPDEAHGRGAGDGGPERLFGEPP